MSERIRTNGGNLMTGTFRIAALLSLFSMAACAKDSSLQGAFEAQMKDNGYDGYEIIHLQENESDGWVLHTAWTKDYPDNRNEPGVNYYQKQGKKWQSAMGTACSSNGVSMFGLMGNGYLYCSVLRPGMEFESITAGGQTAQIYTFNDTMTVWVAISPEANAKVSATTPEGREIALN